MGEALRYAPGFTHAEPPPLEEVGQFSTTVRPIFYSFEAVLTGFTLLEFARI